MNRRIAPCSGEWDESWWTVFGEAARDLLHAQQYREDLGSVDLCKSLARTAKTRGQQLALAGLGVEREQLLKAGTATEDCAGESSDGESSCASEKSLCGGLKQAISAYERSEDDAGPYLIKDYVPFFLFERWYKQQESAWRIAFRFKDCNGGSVWLYGDPSFLHEGITGKISEVITSSGAVLAGGPLSDLVDLMGSSRLILPTGFHKEPDLCMQPVGSKHKIPPFVCEVAYSNESLVVLKEELVEWTLDGGAQIAYGVKVSVEKEKPSGVDVEQRLHLRFLERRQGQQGFLKDIDFSPAACNQKGHPDFIVDFPLSTIFEGATSNSTLLQGVARLDLYILQQAVVRMLKNEHVNFVWHPKMVKSGTERSGLLGARKKTSVFKKIRSWMSK